MIRVQEHIKRYPGLDSFKKEQSGLFFGREKETRELHYLVSLEKIVVLFGRSGLGKTSLLNAGLAPLLEKNNYRPIRIRLKPPDRNINDQRDKNKLIEIFKLETESHIRFDDNSPRLWDHVRRIPFAVNKNPRLWDYVKAAPFIDENGKPFTPVFIFDQFEEFFIHPPDHQREFLEQLAELAHTDPPHRVLEWITSMEIEERTAEHMQWASQPDLKLIFTVRSDRLAGMQSLTPYITTVLRNRYELKPLTGKQAEAAIENPAIDPRPGPDYTQPFRFAKQTLNEIVNKLSGDNDEIESSQLQLICSAIEDIVHKRQQEQHTDEMVEVNETLFNPATDFPNIIDDFYEKQLLTIPDENDRAKARRIIEDELVINGYRDRISHRKMSTTLGVSDELISQMIYTRLIKNEETSTGVSYEITHDTLIRSIEKSKTRRLAFEEQKKLLEEKERLEMEAREKDENLKKQLRQLATEIQLKDEAIEQRKQIEELGKKLKRKSLAVTLLTVGLLIAGIISFIFVFYKKEGAIERRIASLDSTRANYQNELWKLLKNDEPAADTAGHIPPDEQEEEKKKNLSIIQKIDSIAVLTNPADTVRVNNVIDSLFKDDFEKQRIDPRKLNKTQKLKLLKKQYPDMMKYSQSLLKKS